MGADVCKWQDPSSGTVCIGLLVLAAIIAMLPLELFVTIFGILAFSCRSPFMPWVLGFIRYASARGVSRRWRKKQPDYRRHGHVGQARTHLEREPPPEWLSDRYVNFG